MPDADRSLRVLSAAELAEIGTDLRLTHAQTRRLGLVLQDVRADLANFFATRIDRRRRAELTARQKAVGKGFKASSEGIGQDAEDLSQVLPFEVRATLARCLSDEYIQSVTRRAPAPGESVDRWRVTECCFHGGELLQALTADLSGALDHGLAALPRDPGGREPDIVRRCLIMSLAEAGARHYRQKG